MPLINCEIILDLPWSKNMFFLLQLEKQNLKKQTQEFMFLFNFTN